MAGLAEWGVLLKCETPADHPAPTSEQLAGLLEAIPCPSSDKRLTGGGRDFTVWFWIAAVDASEATAIGARDLRTNAASLDMPPIRVVRAHAASSNGRVPPFPGAAERLDSGDTWSVLYRVRARSGHPFTDVSIAEIAERLPGDDCLVTLHSDKEKFLVSDGSAFTARFWSYGTRPSEAIANGRADLLAVLASLSIPDSAIVRAQVTTAEARHGDMFPGADRRVLRPDEETR